MSSFILSSSCGVIPPDMSFLNGFFSLNCALVLVPMMPEDKVEAASGDPIDVVDKLWRAAKLPPVESFEPNDVTAAAAEVGAAAEGVGEESWEGREMWGDEGDGSTTEGVSGVRGIVSWVVLRVRGSSESSTEGRDSRP